MPDVTHILSQIESGDQHASEQLLPLVYEELRKLAAARMSQERPDHTLQATALVHEAFVRLVDAKQAQQWDSRAHFFGAAAEAMRRILVDHARRKCQAKRGGDWAKVDLTEADMASLESEERVLAVNDALEHLARRDAKAAEFIKLRYFAGMSIEETAETLGVSIPTAYSHWAYAKALLAREFSTEG